MASTGSLDVSKFSDPVRTAKGEPRAFVGLTALDTLWFNTGTLCNITCQNCYIESSPRNDRLVYLTLDEVTRYLDEIEDLGLGTREIGFTGGEPFMNPDILAMLDVCLERGYDVLVLTNAMRPMQRVKAKLLDIHAKSPTRLHIRVSLDHYLQERHEEERGAGSFASAVRGLEWLSTHRFDVSIAGRTMWGEDTDASRCGYAAFFAERNICVDAQDPAALVLFPEMDEGADVPEITTACWGILGKSPDSVMCATSRMIVKHKGAAGPVVMPCTLLPYDRQFELGGTLQSARKSVPLNHPHCAKFCVLGGASCSAG